MSTRQKKILIKIILDVIFEAIIIAAYIIGLNSNGESLVTTLSVIFSVPLIVIAFIQIKDDSGMGCFTRIISAFIGGTLFGVILAMICKMILKSYTGRLVLIIGGSVIILIFLIIHIIKIIRPNYDEFMEDTKEFLKKVQEKNNSEE